MSQVKTATITAAAVLLAACGTSEPPPPVEPAPVTGTSARQPEPSTMPAGDAPLNCSGDQRVSETKVTIRTPDAAIQARDQCYIGIYDCNIRGGRVAIHARGDSHVVLAGCTVEGSIVIEDNARITLATSKVDGSIKIRGQGILKATETRFNERPIVSGQGRLLDSYGNTWPE